MQFRLILGVVLLILPESPSSKEVAMKLFSPAFQDGNEIPIRFTCEGEDRSPTLFWQNIPDGTQSLALTCVDPDAPMGDWIHWIAWNIPPEPNTLLEAVDPYDQHRFTQGTNSWGRTGYGGPCPPPGHGTHHYIFTLYALNTNRLHLDSGAKIEDLLSVIEGHVVKQATLTGTYER